MTVAQTAPTGRFTALSGRTGEELELSMQRLWLTGQVTPFGARLLVEHTFESAEPRPVEAVYSFVLPREAALKSFRIQGEGFEATSELRDVEDAVKEYERGIDAGSLAVLARQYVDGLMNLSVGNLRPGEPVRVVLEILAGVEHHDSGFRFRFPFTLAPAYHAKARAVSLPDGGETELPREEFGDLMLPVWKTDARGLHAVGFDLELQCGQTVEEVSSPSHALRVRGEGALRRIGLAVAEDVPDRDLVLDAQASEAWQLAWSRRGSMSVLLGSTRFGEPDEESPRKVVFVLDRSGSMSGAPIEQAKKAIEAGVAALRPHDRFSIVAFDNEVETLSEELFDASKESRTRARTFLSKIDARGGTELAAGMKAAARLVAAEGGDLLLLTDGQVFGTPPILETARRAGARIHVLGIGSASQDRFLSQLGADTGGQCRFLTARERVDLGLLELFASASGPVASNVKLEIEGATLPSRDVFAALPLLVRAGGGGDTLQVSWPRGSFPVPVEEAPEGLGQTLTLLATAAEIAELESRIEGVPEGEEAARLAALSRKHGLASRVMALVAVVEREGDRPGELPQTRVVPVGMPQDLSPEAYFGGVALAAAPIGHGTPAMDLRVTQRFGSLELFGAPIDQTPSRFRRMMKRVRRRAAPVETSAPMRTEEDVLLETAADLEGDGGMPGKTIGERIEASLEALEHFLRSGSTRYHGPFRHHVRRLLDFLTAADLDADQQKRLAELEERAVS